MPVSSVRPTLRAGGLPRRINIEQSSAVSDTEGDIGVTWSVYCTVWAGVEPLTGTEALMAGQMASTVSHLVQMRYFPGITTDMRVHEPTTNLYLDIQAVINVREAQRSLQLMCMARKYEAI
jgi:SPP1 family predicted phage head-tail adaptor